MKLEGNMLVFVILGAAFAGVGIHLLLWSRRKSALVKRFAESRGLVYRAQDVEGLEKRINDCVMLDGQGMVRTFGQVGNIVTVGSGKLFRGVELLDLVPWGKAEYAHNARTAIIFPCAGELEGIFLVSPQLSVHQRYPESPSNEGRLKNLLTRARVPEPPCTLSLTLMRGGAVAYLEPTVAGAVSNKHLEYLVELMERLTAC